MGLPKPLSTPWTGEGEAGDYVEVCSQGGIIRYSAIEKKGEFHTFSARCEDD